MLPNRGRDICEGPPACLLGGLRALRLALDAELSSFSGMEKGERRGTDASSAARGSSGADGARTGTHAADAGDGKRRAVWGGNPIGLGRVHTAVTQVRIV